MNENPPVDRLSSVPKFAPERVDAIFDSLKARLNYMESEVAVLADYDRDSLDFVRSMGRFADRYEEILRDYYSIVERVESMVEWGKTRGKGHTGPGYEKALSQLRDFRLVQEKWRRYKKSRKSWD